MFPMRLDRPIGAGARPVTLQHSPALPAGLSHQVSLRSFIREPLMGECVPQHVRVQVIEPGHLRTSFHFRATAGSSPCEMLNSPPNGPDCALYHAGIELGSASPFP